MWVSLFAPNIRFIKTVLKSRETTGKHIWPEMFACLSFISSTLYIYSPEWPLPLAVTKLSCHLIVYDIRKKESLLFCILHPRPQTQTYHFIGLKRHNSDVLQWLLKHLPFLEPHFCHPMHNLSWWNSLLWQTQSELRTQRHSTLQ